MSQVTCIRSTDGIKEFTTSKLWNKIVVIGVEKLMVNESAFSDSLYIVYRRIVYCILLF